MTKILNKKLKKSSKNWISRQIKDKFTQQKKIQGFRSRSAFKLLEINEKFNFIKNNSHVLDLGSFPGGWSQVLEKKVNRGKIVALDILPMEKINNIDFILGDFLNKSVQSKISKIFEHQIDIVVSDMASNTTGNRDLDSYRTADF